jgi:glycosyltransferase involved in cell wall biosynthesis
MERRERSRVTYRTISVLIHGRHPIHNFQLSLQQGTIIIVKTSVQITVIVCTYNRANSLGKTLTSLVAQTLPGSLEWEIIVVDNNSNDETPQIVESFQRKYPARFRYLLEKTQGVSSARNAGIRDARGDIVAFIDDDETAAPGWLENLTKHLHSGEWAGAGGRVVPEWSFARPRWLLSEHSFTSAPLAKFDADAENEELTEPPFGANMAFRKEVFDKHGGFRTDLGRSGKSLLSSEDTEFGRRLMASGSRLRYEPSAVTYHPVEPFRVRRGYFLAWWFGKGRTDVIEMGIQPQGRRFLGIPLRLFRDAAVEVVRWAVAASAAQRFICQLKVWSYAGQAFESYRRTADSRQTPRGPHANVRSPAKSDT